MKKRILSIALCVILVFGLSSCENSSNEEYYGDYHDGYVEGYDEGYDDAFSDAQSYAEECFSGVCYDNKVEDALTTLILYIDGEPITEAELHKAIWAINDFYYDTFDMIHDLDDYIR